jgi:acyl transferase domain-containing protein/NADPH:quinone reductase-like Zn-dependent oxidoreductase/acyl carrier protein
VRSTEQRQDVVVVGRSCRLPGASSVAQLWSNLLEGRCSVTQIPDDRWSKQKHGHPRPKEPGKAYTWAAGVLDDLWTFDPSVFGISPREAEQMDPQQRLLLELTWEALEDGGIPRSKLAGRDVGVFVGASSPEYTIIRNTDMAGGDAYTATGGAISIISNRISHAFDFQGPSFTVDTACSSSLVALHEAMSALQSGRIDTAIVGGINLLMSPFGFIVFSQASMLSPDGRCQTFDAKANGYVRAEGAVVLVLQTAERARQDDSRMYARIANSGVNSDGRTNGIALPSRYSQGKLLRQLYGESGITPAQMAFVEAHGTGTRVGDPIEAFTIGEVLGKGRPAPLPIGSIKTNIGHLEPASGLAGMLKAMLALEHDILPPSINFSEPNPEIPFDELNLQVAAEPTRLARTDEPRFAGINSFGFGGTNAHAIISDAPRASGRAKRYIGGTDRFAITGASRAAILELARDYSGRVASASLDSAQEMAAAAVHRRELLGERLVVDWRSPRDLARKLERIADKEDDVSGATWGTVTETDGPVAFVFSGNGGQWPGMGRGAYATNRHFREGLDEVDSLFDSQFGWSVTEALFASDLEQRLPLTHVAQPLIFSIQIATARALAAQGITPSVVLGHSVGEIAAAAVSGALPLKDAVHVIHARSAHQELARDTGRMGVIVGTLDQVQAIASEFEGVEIAAYNSPRTFTLAGPTDELKKLGQVARKRRMVYRQLDLDYPFHCALIDCVREPLLRDLKGIKGGESTIPFISTVTGEAIEGTALDADYWWHNVREPVRFAPAVEFAARNGARIFMEIGPRSVLLSNINETLEPTSLPFSALGVLEKKEGEDSSDQIRPAAIAAFTKGAAVDLTKLFGPEPAAPIQLPIYPWQRKDFRVQPSPEAVGFTLDTRWHRLIGGRNTHDGTEWTGQLDTAQVPELGDHVVGGQPILPAAAFIEIALSVAQEWFETETAAVLDIDISVPLQLERDRAKEIKARLSPNTNTVEILSRARLSRSGWQLHAVARITRGEEEPLRKSMPTEAGEVIGPEAIYAAAEAVGLHYGPEFRLLKSVTRVGDKAIVVDLEPSAAHGDYRLDPARLDACFHGLFALFSTLGAQRRGTAYLPVRFGHIRLTRSGALPAKALIEITKAGERSILSEFTLFDADGQPIGALSEVRFQAARVQRGATLAERALLMNAVPADSKVVGRKGVGRELGALLDTASRLGFALGDAAGESQEQLLLEGWATSASYEIARRIDPSLTITREKLASFPAATSAWLASILHSLELSGLATPKDEGWILAEAPKLPDPALVLRTLVGESPARSAEMLLASAIGAVIQSGELSPETFFSPAGGTIDGFELGGASARAASEVLHKLATEAKLLDQDGRARNILQIGYGPLSHALKDMADADHIRLTIFEPDARRLERARLGLGGGHALTLVETPEELGQEVFDVALSAERLHRIGGVSLSKLREAIAPGGLLAAIEPLPSQFRDLTLGMNEGWFDTELSAEFPVSPLQDEEGWTSTLEASGFAEVTATAIELDREAAILLLAEPPRAHALPAPAERNIRIEPTRLSASGDLAERLDALLAMDGHKVELRLPELAVAQSGANTDTVLFVASAATRGGQAGLVQELCLELRACAEAAAQDKAELWVLSVSTAPGAALADPVTAAVLSFARTLANETPNIAVRRVSASSQVSSDAIAEAIRGLMAGEQTETDFVIEQDCVRVLRVEAVPEGGSGPAAGAARLERGIVGGLAGLSWVGIDRPSAGPGEVEIAVEATGLNFRDVMWAMSLLPDDILEDGFAGPTLGLECAGTVIRVGEGVSRFKAGDRVIAFAPSAFATVAAVPQNVVAKVPEGLDTEAAATIPVAFLTAYYALITLAGMRNGEWVLIHGAAGGVGLAAVQIAQHRGAKIIATAGSREKRELLRSLGVEHVLNSRSSAFADDIREICPDGVGIVLNSLAGEAMERGLGVLKPFGRFIELGKRDYVANTRIGLRPFRRNLSYFGVDVDQLLSDRDRASEIFGEIIELFEAGAFKPLPYRVYPAGETVDAFRLMQQSGHIGKIVLRPPSRPVPMPNEAEFRFDPARTHLLTGGFGGFGLETARWLAERGAKHLVLTGRNGAATPEAQAVVAELQARGVDVRPVACDVSDEASVRSLLKQIRADMPPLAGVMHAAMVLEDSLVANMTEEQFANVLNPKVTGVGHLDRHTREDELDYFVLFSSITTFVGNPGQAAYVAANGYLEGVARSRRQQGLPGTAFAWGAIGDVGVLARQKGLAESLAKRVGVKAMPAREALDLMAQALSRDPTDANEAVMAVGSLDWSAARRLPALASPTFAALVREGGAIESSERSSIDLRALVGSGEPDKVRKQVIEIIVEEIAGVLRVPKQDVALGKRLSEIGLDSLMAIELATGLQDRFELSSPPTGSVGALTVPGLAETIIASVHSGAPDDEARVTQALYDRHAGTEVDISVVAPVLEVVQADAQSRRGLLQ